jgi:hypothetical protein
VELDETGAAVTLGVDSKTDDTLGIGNEGKDENQDMLGANTIFLSL